MELFLTKNACCGCGACAAVCGLKAIKIVPDEHGFCYPQIDANVCVECGRCKTTCSFNNMESAQLSRKRYLAKHVSKEVCMQSTSGGMFSALSDVILKENGVVYAADICENMAIRHVCITNREQRDHARGSKYVQSDISAVYASLRKHLREQKKLFFLGTPCQVAAVMSAIPERDREKLYTVDLICNGVGSPLVWQQHVARVEKRFGKKMDYYWFRPKTKGYLTTSEIFRFTDGTQEEYQMALNKFNTLYYSGLIHRPSCTSCRYASLKRMGDISIGDFSKAADIFPDFDSSKGASMMFINTEKGEQLFRSIQNDLEVRLVDQTACEQVRLRCCAEPNPRSEMFLDMCAEYGVEKAINNQFGFLEKMRIKLIAWARGVKQ